MFGLGQAEWKHGVASCRDQYKRLKQRVGGKSIFPPPMPIKCP